MSTSGSAMRCGALRKTPGHSPAAARRATGPDKAFRRLATGPRPVAFRPRWVGCAGDTSSDIVLGHGWAARNWTANAIAPTNPGAGLLIAKGGTTYGPSGAPSVALDQSEKASTRPGEAVPGGDEMR